MDFNEIIENDLYAMYSKSRINKFNSIEEEQKRKWLKIHNLYRKLFTQYIVKKIELNKYDERLSKSGLDFLVNKQEDMDIYQYFSSHVLKYFYIRNNIYLDNLSENELDTIVSTIEKENAEFNDVTEKMIEDTYKKVIFYDILKNGKKCKIFYGPDNGRFLAGNDALILGVRYDELENKDIEESKLVELFKTQMQFLGKTIKEMQIELEDKKIGIPINIIRYNKYCVLRRRI